MTIRVPGVNTVDGTTERSDFYRYLAEIFGIIGVLVIHIMSRSGFALQVSHVSQDFTVLMSFVNFIDRTLKILQLLNLLVELNVVMILLYSIDGSRQLLQVSNMAFNLIEQVLPLD